MTKLQEDDSKERNRLAAVVELGSGRWVREEDSPRRDGKHTRYRRGRNGNAIKGVTLTLTDGKGKETTASSDTKGSASFTGLASGDYDLEGSAAGYAGDSTPLSVESDEQEATLTLALISASEDGSSTSDEETADTGIMDTSPAVGG